MLSPACDNCDTIEYKYDGGIIIMVWLRTELETDLTIYSLTEIDWVIYYLVPVVQSNMHTADIRSLIAYVSLQTQSNS